MIHYHGTPMGGKSLDVCHSLKGRHALIPFFRPDNLAIAMEVCQSFVLDNSAFSLWKKGGYVPFAEYHTWVHSLEGHPGLDWCLIPDKIDGTEEENIALVTRWQREGFGVLSVPVWHLHESLEWLAYLVDKFQIVALGSSGQWATPGTDGWWQRMEQAMGVACNSIGRPKARLHGLRMLDPAIFTRLPLSSADSTNAAVNSGSINRFGMYTPVSAAARAVVIMDRIEAHNSAAAWAASTQLDMYDA